jgi:hypothetical protein
MAAGRGAPTSYPDRSQLARPHLQSHPSRRQLRFLEWPSPVSAWLSAASASLPNVRCHPSKGLLARQQPLGRPGSRLNRNTSGSGRRPGDFLCAAVLSPRHPQRRRVRPVRWRLRSPARRASAPALQLLDDAADPLRGTPELLSAQPRDLDLQLSISSVLLTRPAFAAASSASRAARASHSAITIRRRRRVSTSSGS